MRISPSDLEKIILNARLPIKILNLIKKKDKQAYEDPSAYKILYRGHKGDKNFYTEKCKKGKILYLGVGAGRIFPFIYKSNKQIIGIENSSSMIDYFNKKFPEQGKSLVQCDVLEENLPFLNSSFDKVIAPFSFFTHFEPEEIKIILKKCFNLLKPNAELITDFFPAFKNPSFTKNWCINSVKNNKTPIRKIEVYDHIRQILIECNVFSGKMNNIRLILRYYYPEEIRRLFEESGFKVKFNGDFNNSPLLTKSDIMVVTAKR